MMKALTLKEAEQLKKILHPRNESNQYLAEVRKLYFHGFVVGMPENILWSSFKSMLKDLGITD